MQLTKFPIVLVLLTARACRANIVLSTSEPNESTSNLVEAVVNIVTSCYGDRIETIGLAGNLPDTLIRTLSVRHLIPVALIGNTYGFDDEVEEVPVRFKHKLHVFIVEATSFQQLDSLFEKNIKNSIWWNHMASFFILDMSQNCDISYDLLYLAWQRNVLDAKAMCYRREHGTYIFQYNPFTSQAPVPWRQFKVFPGIMKHPFTAFSRKYRGNKTTCVNWDFEKTKNLGGYVIRVEGSGQRFERIKSNRASYLYVRKLENIYDTLSDVLNTTLRYSGETRIPLPQGQDISKGLVNIVFDWYGRKTTYRHDGAEIAILSHFRGNQSLLKKILSVTNGDSQLGMGVVYLITLIFFKYFVRQTLVPAFLNVIRITSSTRLTNLPTNNPSQIYLGCLLFFATIMQGIYWSKLAFLLTLNIPLRNVDTLQDFMDFGYKTFCISDRVIDLIDHSVVQEHIVQLEDIENCVTEMKHDKSTVYLSTTESQMLDYALNFNLRIGKSIKSLHFAFHIRRDWPLEEQYNLIIQKMVEADILKPSDTIWDPMKLSDFQSNEAVQNSLDFKKIKLHDLTLAFGILGIGLACAMVTFIIEFARPYKILCGCVVFIERRRLIRSMNANNINAI